MEHLKITAGPYTFIARLEKERAPKTCEAFCARLPFKSQFVHVRWSGEGVWAPLGDYQLGVDYENHTCHPSRGDILFYIGGISETEIIMAYGSCSFASKVGALAGNHFLTIVEGQENLEKLAFLDKTSANDLVHSLLVKYIASRKQDIEKYDAFFGEQNT